MRNWIKYRVDRLWRTMATGFCFAYFSLGGLLQSLFVFPVIYALPGSREAKARRTRLLQKRTFANFVGLMERLGLIRVDLHNTELLAKSSGCIVVANHPTLIDVVILLAHLPRANCVVKGALWRNRYLKGVMRAAGFISNESGEKLLNGCRQTLAHNEAVVIFPEGSRSVPGTDVVFKRGVAQVAVRTHAPIMTVFITCTPLTLTKGEPWYKIPPRRAHINVYFHELLQPAEFIAQYHDKPAAARLLTHYLQDYYAKGLRLYG